MIKSSLRVFIACLILLGSVLSTISWAEQETVDVKPPTITLSSCLSTFTGAESLSLLPVLEVSNPNNFLISV